jgi:hypothetical protein
MSPTRSGLIEETKSKPNGNFSSESLLRQAFDSIIIKGTVDTHPPSFNLIPTFVDF